MDRRAFLSTLAGGLLATPLVGEAQPARVFRIGVLSPGYPGLSPLLDVFRQGLHELGYFENQNLVIESRSAEGNLDRLPALAAEVGSLKVDVIVAPNTPAALAAQRATSTLPIVFIAAGDPVTTRLVASLARPGGNITGVSALSSELVGKWLELLKQAVPGVSRVAVFWQPGAMDERTDKD
ncbi:MAG TPA: ABC transporter substrate-binding protein, partial [Gemmatimonadales bacterium]|nr:ABC transporter substrate-binding protein [Gemmatimonadales bacterium]